ncbi:MAG: Peptidoglycan-binding domain 1 protein [Acidimicrobiales bacterium]|jgi:hypothetical protein|nr:Peptidoglycan-binding domain 1 protein [Acidimicrobiales bacterium]
MHDSLLHQIIRRVLLRLVALLRAAAGRIERQAARPAFPLPPWADAARVDAAWVRASRRSLAACAMAAFVLATFGTAAAAFQARPTGRVTVRLARAGAAVPAPTDHPAAEAYHSKKTVPKHPSTTSAPKSVVKPVAPKPVPKLPTYVQGVRPDLPVGKGMWIWLPDKSDGGDPVAIVARAKAVGLTHVYVRIGSSWDGFNGAPFLAQLIPVAHAANIKVFGWDFPRLLDWPSDVNRALAAITFRAPNGQSIDGFAADIETPSEGTYLTTASADTYGAVLRKYIPKNYPLIAVTPRPSAHTVEVKYPYDKILAHFDAVAPMVYWLNRQPDSDVAGAMRDLAPFGKPIIPVGQAYDGAAEGGRPGVPTRDELSRFMATAAAQGAPGVSFWSWQHADQEVWDAIRDAPQFRLSPSLARRSWSG